MTHQGKWQERPDLMDQCDVVFGCVDTFAGRRDLEAECRRYLIPYIDIGMDVHKVGDDSTACWLAARFSRYQDSLVCTVLVS